MVFFHDISGTVLTMGKEYDLSSKKEKNAKLFHHGAGKHQVLLVHGFNSSEKIWLPTDDDTEFSIADALTEMGFGCWLLRFSDPVNGNIEQLALNELLTACNFIKTKSGEKVGTIVAHSMGGVITRYLLARMGKKEALSDLKNVVLLAVPNHGVSLTFFLRQAERLNELVPRIIAVLEERTPLILSNRAFYQLTEFSSVIQLINDKKHFLHPKICWYNAIASKDVVVPRDSAAFKEEEIKSNRIKCFDQREFRATHMANSLQLLDQVISPVVSKKLSKQQNKRFREILQQAMNVLDYVLAPPIYRSKECFDWWSQRLTL